MGWPRTQKPFSLQRFHELSTESLLISEKMLADPRGGLPKSGSRVRHVYCEFGRDGGAGEMEVGERSSQGDCISGGGKDEGVEGVASEL